MKKIFSFFVGLFLSLQAFAQPTCTMVPCYPFKDLDSKQIWWAIMQQGGGGGGGTSTVVVSGSVSVFDNAQDTLNARMLRSIGVMRFGLVSQNGNSLADNSDVIKDRLFFNSQSAAQFLNSINNALTAGVQTVQVLSLPSSTTNLATFGRQTDILNQVTYVASLLQFTISAQLNSITAEVAKTNSILAPVGVYAGIPIGDLIGQLVDNTGVVADNTTDLKDFARAPVSSKTLISFSGATMLALTSNINAWALTVPDAIVPDNLSFEFDGTNWYTMFYYR